jgi:hypothetical protein
MINGGIYATEFLPVEVLNGQNKLFCRSGYLSVLMRISDEVVGRGARRRARMRGKPRMDGRRWN